MRGQVLLADLIIDYELAYRHEYLSWQLLFRCWEVTGGAAVWSARRLLGAVVSEAGALTIVEHPRDGRPCFGLHCCTVRGILQDELCNSDAASWEAYLQLYRQCEPLVAAIWQDLLLPSLSQQPIFGQMHR
jgi:hypothetical protein